MRILFRFLGIFCLVVAVLGIFLPLIPTTPLLLAAMYFFSRSSTKMEQFIKSNKLLNSYVEPYLYKKPVQNHIRIRTLMILWGTLFISSLFVGADSWVVFVLLLVGMGVTLHILMLESSPES